MRRAWPGSSSGCPTLPSSLWASSGWRGRAVARSIFSPTATSEMAVTRYRRFLRLCEEWPLDQSKGGRDLGAFLRQRVALAFREGESTQIADPEKCDQMYDSLARINTAYYKNKYPRLRNTCFTGVTVEECRMVLATDNMKQMEAMKKGMWKKLREKFTGKSENVTKQYV